MPDQTSRPVKKSKAGKNRHSTAQTPPVSSSSSDATDSDSSQTSSLIEDGEVVELNTLPPVPHTGHVSKKLRKSIEKGEDINLNLLLRSNKEDEQPNFQLDPATATFKPVIKKHKLSPTQWNQAFLVFMAIRIERFPNESLGLIRHMQNVQDLLLANKDGIEYDRRFRKSKYQHPNLAWGRMVSDIVNLIPTLAYQPTTFRPKRRSPPVGPKPKCFKFNQGQPCPYGVRCRFLHNCSRCNGPHPQSACKSK